MKFLIVIYGAVSLVAFFEGVFVRSDGDTPQLRLGMFLVPTYFIGYGLTALLLMPIGKRKGV